MKKLFLSPATWLTLLFAIIFSTAFSQDDIIMQNDNVVRGKVEEVGVNLIRYRKADNMDGPIYDMPKGDVYMIVYSNGSRDVINPRGSNNASSYSSQSDDIPAPAPVRQAPPEMPVYEQPLCPTEGYLWTPGYWAFGFGGYYWVPGVWVSPPHPNYLWTPGYWGFAGGFYGWHEGYWGEHIGYYGGVNYGYGYGGSGYYGGRWEGGEFRYNTAVSRVNVTVIHTTYEDRTVVRNNNSRASFNGEGGVRYEASPEERRYDGEKHINHTEEQRSHIVAARNDKSQYESENHGKPAVVTMNKANGERYTQEGHVNTARPVPVEQHNNMQHEQPHAGQPNEQQREQPHPGQVNEQHNQPQPPAQQHTETNAPHGAPNEQHNNNPAGGQQHFGQTTQQQHPTGPPAKNQKTNTPKPAPKPAPPVKNEPHK